MREPRPSQVYRLPGFAGIDDPWAPYGRDPATGTPMSSRSQKKAGLGQLLLGGFGTGRFYLGHYVIGLCQLVLLVVGWWLFLTVGVGFFILLGLGVWTLVDAIVILSGGARDGHGRVLRP